MAKQYEIPSLATKYILFQRTRYLTKTSFFKFFRILVPWFDYNRMVELQAKLKSKKVKAMYLADMEKEYFSIKTFLPNDCSRILDIGCGVAGIDLFLNQHYLNLNREIDFFLLDKTRIEENVYYSYKEKGAFYNSLSIAKEIFLKNGIDINKIHLIEATENNSIEIDKGVDLILSIISWGFHYPISTYLESAYDLLNKNGTLILDVRKNTDGLDLLTQRFGGYRIIQERRKYFRVCATK